MNDPVLRFLEIFAVTGLAIAAIKQLATTSTPTTPSAGLRTDRRGTPDHRDPNGKSRFGFGPIKAEES